MKRSNVVADRRTRDGQYRPLVQNQCHNLTTPNGQSKYCFLATASYLYAFHFHAVPSFVPFHLHRFTNWFQLTINNFTKLALGDDGLNITERYKVQPLSMNAWTPALVMCLSYSQRLRETGEKTVCAAVSKEKLSLIWRTVNRTSGNPASRRRLILFFFNRSINSMKLLFSSYFTQDR
jgi:hypothetical protein